MATMSPGMTDRRRVDELVRDIMGTPVGSPKIDAFLGRLEYADRFREQQLGRVWVWRQMYHLRVVDERPDGSNLPSQTPYEIVEAMVAQLYSALVADPATFLVTDNDLLVEAVESIQRFHNNRLKEARYARAVNRWLRELCIAGHSSFYYGLTFNRFKDGSSSQGLHLSPLLFEEHWLDPMSNELIEPSFFFLRTSMRRSRIAELVSEGIYNREALEQIDTIRDAGEFSAQVFNDIVGPDAVHRVMTLLKLPSPFDDIDPVDPLIPIIEGYGDFVDEQGEIAKDRLQTMAWGAVPMRDIENPFHAIPVITGRLIPHEAGPFGKSVIEAIEPLTKAESEMTNMRLDLWAQNVENMYTATDDVELSQDRLYYEPGKVVRIGKDPGGLQALDSPRPPEGAFVESQLFSQRARESVAITDLVRGETTPPRKTRGEVRRLSSNISTRFRIHVEVLGDSLNEMHKHLLMILSEHADEKVLLSIQGTESQQTITSLRQDMARVADMIRVNADPERADVPGNRARFLSLIQTVFQVPGGATNVNLRRVFEKLLESFGFHHRDPLILMPERFADVSFEGLLPSEEHLRLLQGIPIEVMPSDNDVAHIEDHLFAQKAHPELAGELQVHIKQHFQQLIAKVKANNRSITQGIIADVGVPAVPGAFGALTSQGGT